MPETKTLDVGAARYALQVLGQQDEYGLSEGAYRFQASVVSLVHKSDLSLIHGFMVQREVPGNLCVRIKHASDKSVFCKPVEITQGAAAAKLIGRGVDVLMHVSCEKVLFLHEPNILDVDDRQEPGFRLLAAMKRHFSAESLDVVVDLGTTEGNEEFNEYFFPHTDLLNLEFHGIRFLRGLWAKSSKERVKPYAFGVIYE